MLLLPMQTSHAAEAFFTYARVDRMYAAETQIKIKDCFRSWILPAFGAREVESLSVMDILKFRRAMVDRPLSIARQYSLLVFLKLFLKFCNSFLKLSVMDPGEIRLPRRPQRRVEFLTDEEVKQLLLVVSADHFTGLRLRLLLEVLLSTGMRISEALSLNRDAAESLSGEVEIVGKGSKPRTVFISPGCRDWMRRFLGFRRDTHPALFITTGEQPPRHVQVVWVAPQQNRHHQETHPPFAAAHVLHFASASRCRHHLYQGVGRAPGYSNDGALLPGGGEEDAAAGTGTL